MIIRKMDGLNLKGKTSLITGGTSGIGLEIAKTFALNGADVIITGRDGQKGRQAKKEVDLSCGRKACTFYRCDSGILKEVKSTCRLILSVSSRIDVMVLNAATEFTEPIDKIKIKNWDRVFDVNVKGAFYFIRFLVGTMIKWKKGNIIIIGSVASYTGAGGGMHYSSSKAALKGICARINYELLSKGIRANIISPGVIDTPMLRKKYPDTPEINKKLDAQVPFGRIGRPSDVSGLALFLASDISEYICGQDIVVDGGRMLFKRPSDR
jgi:3-oxoacyl-[acyl-carrier protein] reductase